ncbi:ABC transporter ATP-binding protein [Halobacteriaceae archaeon GCM10025711]
MTPAHPSADTEPLLEVSDLSVRFELSEETVYAVNGVDLAVDHGETLGVVGESGSGKSVTALSILGLLEGTARTGGVVRFDGEDLLTKPEEELREIRGNRISMVFQDPGSSLNPVLPVGDQISETIRTHQSPGGEGISAFERSILGNLVRSRTAFTQYEASWQRTVELFEEVGIPLPEKRAVEFPHEFSGGMKQRALIAIAISCQPDLLVVDEPTTALDVTIEAQILELLEKLQEEFGTAILFITHDMGVIREVTDRVAVMYAGNVVETAPTDELFESPKHPYTRALLRSVPRIDGDAVLDPVEGSVPDLTREPRGCQFAPRCPEANDACSDAVPPAYPVSPSDEPTPVVPRDNRTPTHDAPAPRPDRDETHLARCVLYGDGAHLTTDGQPSEEVPDE